MQKDRPIPEETFSPDDHREFAGFTITVSIFSRRKRWTLAKIASNAIDSRTSSMKTMPLLETLGEAGLSPVC
jgi:hypothetical protein